MLKDLDDSTEMWRIVVRVLRRWNSYHKNSPNQLYAICLLLVDQQGDTIQASVMNKSLFKQFDQEPLECHCYFIANLEVIPNGKDYKAANHPFKLLFNTATYVKEENADIPLSVFNFFPIKDILNQTVDHHTMFLFDVIAFLISIDPLEEYYSGADQKRKLRLILDDGRGNTVRMVLYDDCASTFATQDFTAIQTPTVLLAQLARIGFDEGVLFPGRPEVCTSFNATKIQLNAKFQEVQEFISSAKHLPSPMLSSLTPTTGTQSSTSAAETILRNTATIKVTDIHLQEVGKFFAVNCEFKKFLTRDGWCYDGCSRCGTKAKDTNGVFSCVNTYCRGKRCTVVPKFRLNYLIADESGTASVVFFDKYASEILKKSAAQLKADIPKEHIRFAFPKEVDNLLGKRMILKMKLNKYNKDHPNSSVSVSTYAEATNLAEAFDTAATEVREPSMICNDDEEEEIILMTNCIAATKGPAAAEANVEQPQSVPTIHLDDITTSDDLQVIPSKGKRKVSSKKHAAQALNIATYGPSSPAKTPLKPLKTIKQEKN